MLVFYYFNVGDVKIVHSACNAVLHYVIGWPLTKEIQMGLCNVLPVQIIIQD